MFKRVIPILFVLIASFGCTDDTIPEPAAEFDVRAEILGVVSPDSVEAAQPFRVQISFPGVCGGSFSRVDRYNSSSTITLTPVLHVIPQSICLPSYPIQTITREASFSARGRYEIVASGRFGDLRKSVIAVSSLQPSGQYRLQFLFQDAVGLPKVNQTTNFLFPDKVPNGLMSIQSDSAGKWETTFSDTLPRVRYTIGGMTFEAVKGIPESGVLYFP